MTLAVRRGYFLPLKEESKYSFFGPPFLFILLYDAFCIRTFVLCKKQDLSAFLILAMAALLF